ncbi:tRNA (N6-threonylcarbamoyladenosine(37)-N6)-methyltransferase TrmO [Pollutibacter soli]|uniref:tRNA (N6-threonylcarbamoyladenosine(37)-N6)-methyltransferase TrmO n=1 Tax=Pollutibacter soli TaxID=3034157 RepID=UPI003013A371
MDAEILFIGYVESEIKSIQEAPLQEFENAPTAILKIKPEFAKAAADLKAGDRIIILTWMHLSDRKELNTHPRNDPNAKLTGIFSTRSPNRPNPIGMHETEITALLPLNRIQVAMLEVLDGTPVIDIKPVL